MLSQPELNSLSNILYIRDYVINTKIELEQKTKREDSSLWFLFLKGVTVASQSQTFKNMRSIITG